MDASSHELAKDFSGFREIWICERADWRKKSGRMLGTACTRWDD
jgi:hypothetical protein